jgi:hypothetical protein
MNNQELPNVVEDSHQTLLWLIPTLDRLPRQRRFTLGERLESALLEVLEALVQAAYRRDKVALLVQANSRLQVVRHLWRLCHELKGIDTRRYAHGARLLENLGRQIGGWLRSQG